MSESARQRGAAGNRAGAVREVAAAYGVSTSAGERPVRKNHYLYQSKLDVAKKILDVNTETEALDRALDLLIYGEALALGTEAMGGEEYVDVLGVGEGVPGSGEEP
jgi:hypothetical protein